MVHIEHFPTGLKSTLTVSTAREGIVGIITCSLMSISLDSNDLREFGCGRKLRIRADGEKEGTKPRGERVE